MLILNSHIILFLILLALLLNSCGDSSVNNISEYKGTVSFQVTGNLKSDFKSINIKFSKPDSNTKYLTIFSSITESSRNTTFVLRIFIEDKNKTKYEIKDDNSITYSLLSGAESYKSINGTFNILEWSDNSFIANFNSTLERIDKKESVILIENGMIDLKITN